MEYTGVGSLQNTSRMVQEILTNRVKDQMTELSDAYGIDIELLERISVNMFVTHNDKVLWKSSRTRFTKAYEKEVNKLIIDNVVSFEELGLLLFLSTNYTNYEDNYLRIDDEYCTKKELLEDLHEKTKNSSKSSLPYYKKKILELEKKSLILSEPSPKDKRNKIFYLSPHLFYKGKYMDGVVKGKLLNIIKGVHEDIKKLKEDNKIDIELNSDFENKNDEEIANEIVEYLNSISA